MIHNIISFFLFILIIIPILKINYRRDQSRNTLVKILNPIICFALFEYHFNILYKKILWIIHNYNSFSEKLYIELGRLTPIINISSYFITLVIAITMICISILLLIRSHKALKLLYIIIPLAWISDCIDIYRFFVENYQYNFADRFLLFILLFFGIIGTGIYLFFSSKVFKQFINYE